MLRRIAVLICTVFVLFSFTSCNVLDADINGLLTPPKQDGYTYPIQKALEDSVGDKITLKYPISGNYRTAFTLMDIDGDTVNEAVALYSLTTDGTVSMHLNVIDYENDEWISRSDVNIVGNGVEKIEFCDLNNDSIPEIIVGWMVYGTVDKQVGIYTYENGVLNQRAMEKYTDFVCAKFRDTKKDDFILLNLNSNEKTSTLKILELSGKGIVETGSAILDGGVTSYSTPLVASLSDGTPALFIDAIKGTGTLTEIVWFEKDRLRTIYDSALGETNLTFRPSTLTYVTDINGDLSVEIPVMSLLGSTAEKPDAEKVYVTKWCSFNGKKLKVLQNTFMNYNDGYFFTVPEKWLNKLYLARQPDLRQRIIYSYDEATALQGDELFRIIAISPDDIDTGDIDLTGYEKIAENKELLYFVKIAENNSFKIDIEFFKENFALLG
jgi:hypothetical protein